MTFEAYLAQELCCPVYVAEQHIVLCEKMAEVLSNPDAAQGMRAHYDRKQRTLANKQRAFDVGAAGYAYTQGAANQAGFEPDEWQAEILLLQQRRESWAEQFTTRQEEQT